MHGKTEMEQKKQGGRFDAYRSGTFGEDRKRSLWNISSQREIPLQGNLTSIG